MSKPDVRLVPLSEDSLLQRFVSPGDFVDCYASKAEVSPREAAMIVTEWPGWARFLLGIRRVLTTPFGLSNDGPDAQDKLGAFPVEQETDQELIAGFDDKHLNFRISVMNAEGEVRLATWVNPHNIFGRLYLALIMPFHKMIARNAVARVAARANHPSAG